MSCGISAKRSLPSNPGALIFLAFLLIALLSPYLAPHDPWKRYEPYLGPSRDHPLGTNDMGNDILSELMFGSRVSLGVGLGAAIIATLMGTIIGASAGYFRGWMDEVLMGITDIFLMIPQIPLVIVVAAFLKPSAIMITLIMGLLWWTSLARIVRSRVLQVREMAFVEAAKVIGFPDRHIILTDVLPNTIHVIMPKFMLTVASAMIAEASLSFLGLGDPNAKSWGMMINFAFSRGGFLNGCWWWYMPPGICITLSVLSLVSMSMLLEESREDEHVAS
ncbi:MAG TPA: ABC transporter permease [Methanothrix sp.]|nr:ABC transporter permease [Methanothrix sp.]HOK57940.1 ABC transporter permease [Methanothrix sp.]HOL43343.1 ABC transporter permease [Methanothrix sp.]HPO88254.1 ABC transporter permease [Methanothrix sp.]